MREREKAKRLAIVNFAIINFTTIVFTTIVFTTIGFIIINCDYRIIVIEFYNRGF